MDKNTKKNTSNNKNKKGLDFRTLSFSLVSLGGFYRDYTKGQVQLPSHQNPRFLAGGWNDRKKKKWINRIKRVASDKNLPSNQKAIGGVITTYQIEKNNSQNMSGNIQEPKFINDGAHRAIHAIKDYLEKTKPDLKLKKKNLKKFNQQQKNYEKFLSMLDEVLIGEEFKLYKDEDAAMQDFVSLNTEGSRATAYEILTGIMEGKIEKHWGIGKDKILSLKERIENVTPDRLIFLGFKPKDVGAILIGDSDVKKKQKQNTIRDSRASFLRFVNKNIFQSPYFGISRSRFSDNTGRGQSGHKKIEPELFDFFKNNSLDYCLQQIEKWECFAQDAFAFYKQICKQKEFQEFEINYDENAIRWWFAAFIYINNNNLGIEFARKFTESFLIKQKNGQQLTYTNKKGQIKVLNLQLQKFNNTYVTSLGLDAINLEEKSNKPCRKKPNLKPVAGFHNSHIKSFAKHGEGETVPENAIENRARGVKDMTVVEKQRILFANV